MRAVKKYMNLAIQKALEAKRLGDYAIGAVLVHKTEVISVCGERLLQDQVVSAHAEILAICEGNKKFNNRHLEGCILYSTHEPCPMCASAIVWSKLKGVVYGARMSDMQANGVKGGSSNHTKRIIDIPCREILCLSNFKIELIEDFMRDECIKLFY
jgi:tRNA(Arg) A34 adenosine deaminase TadA